MIRLTRDTLNLMARYADSDKPLWLTEFGYGLDGHTTLADQARLLTHAYRLAVAEPRIERLYWFTLRDLERDILGLESSMGLLTQNWERKPAFYAYQSVAAGAA